MYLFFAETAETIADNVLRSLDILWRGALAIFLVIAILIGVVALLNYATLPAAEKAARADARAARKTERKAARDARHAEKAARKKPDRPA